MKKCPFCAEEIQDQAVKCRFCGTDLSRKKKGRNCLSGCLIMVLLGIAVFALLIYGGYLVIIMVFRKLSGNSVTLPFDMPLPSWLKGIERQFSNIFSFFQEFLRRFKDVFAQGEKWV